jgi:uncharacterized protein YacL
MSDVGRSYLHVQVLRICLVAVLAALAGLLRPFGLPTVAVVSGTIGVALLVSWAAARLRFASLQAVIGGSVGFVVGSCLGLLFAFVLGQAALLQGPTLQFFRLAIPIVAAYAGILVGISKSELIRLDSLGFSPDSSVALTSKLLDTSVLIDGRIADIAESGFLDGRLIVPQFVLHELQLVADSADSARRNRGRRGLDVVQKLQKLPRVHLDVSVRDFPAIREVDRKLIEFAKEQRSKIVTNDFNLNKLAQVQGVEVLNINELANSLKPIVLPGEVMRVFILKEGKEHNQGVAYLDDGTMVVVDNARRAISKTIDITVTTVLQTTAGKMIFGRYDDRQQTADIRAAASAGSGAS